MNRKSIVIGLIAIITGCGANPNRSRSASTAAASTAAPIASGILSLNKVPTASVVSTPDPILLRIEICNISTQTVTLQSAKIKIVTNDTDLDGSLTTAVNSGQPLDIVTFTPADLTSFRPLTLDLQSTTILPGQTFVLEVRVNAPNAGVNDTMQLILDELVTDHGIEGKDIVGTAALFG